MDKLFVTRIGNRVLAEHFLAWREQTHSEGIVTDCRLADVVKSVAQDVERLVLEIYGTCPEIIFEGKLETKVPTIPEHVEYITREVRPCFTLRRALALTVTVQASRYSDSGCTYNVDCPVWAVLFWLHQCM